MDRDLFPHIPVVLAVARRGGFAAAAAELGMSPSTVSHAVKMVEERLGAPLFARTTRSVALTETGARFVKLAENAVQSMNTAWDVARSDITGASGLLRINAPRIALDWVLTPVLQAMATSFPDVTVEVFFEDGLADVIEDRFDAGIRLGRMVSEEMVVVRLAPRFRIILVAAPTYLERHGTPQTLRDLTQHQCIQYRMTSAGNIHRWDLRDVDSDVQVETRGRVIVNDMLRALVLANAGMGICYTFEPLARDMLRTGQLREVLPEASLEEDGLSLYFPQRASRAPKLRAFIDTARQVLA
ncbi:MAG: LysR family transcriptional regulator [Roseitalea sp.]|jgi:DNA-binding transcriptional LysR family regulator|nr:LysR family transcriptional regulator [Roseitalea sp.]MBO6721363.1 LysR family transcriptional regulator [Roseitalea sp.]MBO6744548.1 LysR family transcriptional regulator [Roseitalea sp.]